MSAQLPDWNGKLHVVNGSPLSKPYPSDRLFWIVTWDGDAREVSWCADAKYWTGVDEYHRTDGEPGFWTADEIAGWTFDGEDAEEAAALLLEAAQ